jgi:hypothetical protein
MCGLENCDALLHCFACSRSPGVRMRDEAAQMPRPFEPSEIERPESSLHMQHQAIWPRQPCCWRRTTPTPGNHLN